MITTTVVKLHESIIYFEQDDLQMLHELISTLEENKTHFSLII
jgi:hypothetical protein